MNLDVTRARVARVPVLSLRHRLYFLLDAAVVAVIFVVVSYLTWGPKRVWRISEIMLPAAAIVISLALLKITVLRNETDRVRRLAKLHVGIVVTYALVSLYLVFTRGYYSRFFLLSSFIAIVLWQTIDTFFISARLGPQLVAIPSSTINHVRALPDANLTVLRTPVLEHPVDGVVVDPNEPLQPEWQKFLVECAVSGVPVYHAAAIYEAYSGRIPLTHMSERSIPEILGRRKTYRIVKRVLDVLLVVASTPVALPLSLLVAFLIKLDSPGPALYWQERVGERGRPFRMVKFRSMCLDAEKDGPRFAASDDPRVTRVGRILRRFRLDEIPQLWNVLKGEMSLIGPRPEQVAFAQEFEQKLPYYAWRHVVKPGITGWAQVHDGYAVGIEDTRRKLEYDLYYVKHMSFWLDLSILIRTVGTVVTGNGAR